MAALDVHPSAEELRQLALGTLVEDAALTVETHVAVCTSCQESVATASGDRLVQLLRSAHARFGGQGHTDGETGTKVPEKERGTTFDLTSAYQPTEVSAEPPDAPPELAHHDRYRIVRLLGTGGMGAVYEAAHRVMERPVALKVIKRAFTAEAAAVERFRREVRAVARLTHPHIVTTYDAEDIGETLFLVMEYVEGITLGRLVKERGPLSVAEACAYVRQAALGLQHAHERRMVHRDIKPDNLIRCADGTIKILDFGLAVLTTERGAGLTDSNVVVGTPDFMAPEQAEDPRSADSRADVYSLGCTLFFLLTGQVPYPASTSVRKILAHREQRLPPLRQVCPGVPRELEAIVTRLLAKKPEDRYQTCAEVASLLEPFTRAPKSPPRRRKTRLALLAALLLVGVIAAGAVYRIQTDKGELVITTEHPGVEVVLKQNGKVIRIIDTKTEKQITLRLRSGTYELELNGASEGLKLDVGRVTIRQGATALATIEQRPIVRDRPAEAKTDETRSRPEGNKPGLLRRIPQSGGIIMSTAISTQGGCYCVGNDQPVRLYRLTSGELIRELPGNVMVSLTPDGKHLLSLNDSACLFVEVATGKEVTRFQGHEAGIYNLLLSPDGKRALSYDANKVLILWDPFTGKETKRLEAAWGRFSMDGRFVLFSPDRKELRLWDLDAGREAGHLDAVEDQMYAESLPGGKKVVRFCTDRTLQVWDVAHNECQRTIELGEDCHFDDGTVFALSPDGKRALTTHKDGMVRLWDLASGKDVWHDQAAGPARGMSFSPDGRYAAAGVDNGRWLYLWRLPDTSTVAAPPGADAFAQPGEILRFQGYPSVAWVTRALFSRDGRRVLASCTFTADVRVLEVKTGKVLSEIEAKPGGWGLVLTPDGKQVFYGTDDHLLRLLDVDTGEQVRSFEGHRDRVDDVAVSPDGRLVLSASPDRTVRLWEVKTGKERFCLDGQRYQGLAFAPDGLSFAAVSVEDRAVRLFEVAEGKQLREFSKNGTVVGAGGKTSFSPDGTRLVVACFDNTLRLYEVKTGKELQVFRGHTKYPWMAVYSPDGRRILSGGEDGTVRLWDAATARELACFNAGKAMVSCVSFAPDGRLAVSSSLAGGVRLWRLPDPAAPK